MRCLVIFIFLFLAAAVIVDAADLDENRLQLDKIKSRIEKAQKALDKRVVQNSISVANWLCLKRIWIILSNGSPS